MALLHVSSSDEIPVDYFTLSRLHGQCMHEHYGADAQEKGWFVAPTVFTIFNDACCIRWCITPVIIRLTFGRSKRMR